MKMWKTISILACACALCFALAGCGSSDNAADDAASTDQTDAAAVEQTDPAAGAEAPSADEAAQVVGRWDVYAIDNGDETITIDDVDDATRDALSQQYIEIRDDGTLSMVDESQGFSQDCAWELDGTTLTLSFDGNPLYTMELDGDRLSMSAEGMTMVYQKA